MPDLKNLQQEMIQGLRRLVNLLEEQVLTNYLNFSMYCSATCLSWGPRPHLWRQNEMYGTKISKYMVRHFVKPGVTGLAQVRGYRGEIETREDIVNRTKYDIFYIENWSLLMDINIIIQTVSNVFKGEEKAY